MYCIMKSILGYSRQHGRFYTLPTHQNALLPAPLSGRTEAPTNYFVRLALFFRRLLSGKPWCLGFRLQAVGAVEAVEALERFDLRARINALAFAHNLLMASLLRTRASLHGRDQEPG
jgi:hypothetical protein